MYWRLLAAIFLLLPIQANALTVEGWKVETYPANGTPTGCGMRTTYQDYTVFTLLVTREYTWAIALENASWNLADSGTTEVALYVDSRFTAGGKAHHISTKSALFPLSGVEPYKALQRGYRLDIQTPAGALNFSLKGTSKAMTAVLDCVRLLNRSTPQAPPQAASADFSQVPVTEATVMLANLLNAAGLKDYNINPPTPKSHAVSYTLADGTIGSLVAARGRDTVSADEYAGSTISQLSGLCTGDFLSGKETVPSTDGTVIRKVKSVCRADGTGVVTETTILRRPDGLLVRLSQFFSESVNQLKEDGGETDRGNVMDAALRVSGTWR